LLLGIRRSLFLRRLFVLGLLFSSKFSPFEGNIGYAILLLIKYFTICNFKV
jgi:hypothetical protein